MMTPWPVLHTRRLELRRWVQTLGREHHDRYHKAYGCGCLWDQA